MKFLKGFMFLSLIISFSVYASASVPEDAKVVSFSGKVTVSSPGEKPVTPRSDMILVEGTRIETGRESYIGLAFGGEGKNTLNISSESDVVIKFSKENKIELIDGEIFILLKDLPAGQDFKVKTPAAVCGARGTGWVTRTDGEITEVLVFDNIVYLRGINKDGSLMPDDFLTERGFKRSVRKYQEPGKKKKLSEEELSEMDEEALFAGNVVKFLARKDKLDAFDVKDEKRMDALDKRLEQADFGSRSGFDRMMDTGGAPVGGGRGDDDD